MQIPAHTTKKHPREPQLDRDVAARLAITEYERVTDLFASLTPAQWAAPTDCPGWDVRAMAGHMLGMVQMVSSVRRMMQQQLAASRHVKRDGGEMVDAVTAWQVAHNADLTTEALVDELRRLGPRAARFRRRAPGVMRGRTTPYQDEWWTLGYALDVIFTRDPFLHRVDVSRAAGIPMMSTPDHEGVIVADAVAEWAGRHGVAYDLTLTGPAGGHWSDGAGERIEMDALEFCRAVSGRAPVSGLLTVQVPF